MWRKIFRKRWRCYVWDGKQWLQTRARVGHDGIEFWYAHTWVTITQELVWDLGRSLIVAVEPVVMADHVALERARHQIALHALFETGGDLMRYLQIAAVVVPLLAAVYMAFRLSALDDLATSVKALITLLESSPIIKR